MEEQAEELELRKQQLHFALTESRRQEEILEAKLLVREATLAALARVTREGQQEAIQLKGASLGVWKVVKPLENSRKYDIFDRFLIRICLIILLVVLTVFHLDSMHLCASESSRKLTIGGKRSFMGPGALEMERAQREDAVREAEDRRKS